MSDEPRDILGGAPVQAARYRLCIQCGEGFLHTEARHWCQEECEEAYRVQKSLGGEEPVQRQLHVSRYLLIGDPIVFEGAGYILLSIVTRGPGATVGEFLETRFLPSESPLLQ